MHNDLQTLSKLFTEKLFRIPDYQRGYAWGHAQLDDFWSDLNQVNQDSNHYTGVLTLEAVPQAKYEHWPEDLWLIRSKGFEPFYVVDGQQRLTTSIILIQCISETLRTEAEKLNYTTKSEIQKKYIFEKKDEGVSRSYIFGYEKDNPSYEYLKTEIFNEDSPTSRKEETAYTNNLMNAKNFFLEKISQLSRNQIEEIYTKITQKFLFNIFSISEEVDVCVAFETMNNRGKPLSYLELLKNRLIYLTTKLNVESYECESLRRTINDCWKTIYHNLGRNKENPLDDDFFLKCHHFLRYTNPIPTGLSIDELNQEKRRLANALERPSYKSLLNEIFTFANIIEERNASSEGDKNVLRHIYDYSISLQETVKKWYEINNPIETTKYDNFNFWLSKLDKICPRNTYPVLLAVMLSTPSEEKRTEAFRAIERMIFVEKIASGIYRYDGLHLGILDSAIKLYRREIDVDALISEINSETSRILATEWAKKQMRESLRSRNYYSWQGIRYFLYEYNLQLQIDSKTNREKIKWATFAEREEDYSSIEHIYPQKAQIQYWRDRFKGLSAQQRETLKNVVGNLLPLSKAKNSSLSNASYVEKIKGKTPGVGYAYGSYAENEVVTLYSEWTPRAVMDRSLRMLDFMEMRWGISLGKDSEKLEILGLNFIKPDTRMHPRIYFPNDTSSNRSPNKKFPRNKGQLAGT